MSECVRECVSECVRKLTPSDVFHFSNVLY
jgi:hypothetical protein